MSHLSTLPEQSYQKGSEMKSHVEGKQNLIRFVSMQTGSGEVEFYTWPAQLFTLHLGIL